MSGPPSPPPDQFAWERSWDAHAWECTHVFPESPAVFKGVRWLCVSLHGLREFLRRFLSPEVCLFVCSSVPDPCVVCVCRFDTDPDPRFRTTGLRIWILLFSFQETNQKQAFCKCFFLLPYFLQVHFTSVFKESHKTAKIKVFLIFVVVGGRIRILIRNTGSFRSFSLSFCNCLAPHIVPGPGT